MKKYLATSVSRLILVIGQIFYLKIITSYIDAENLGVYYFLITVSYFISAMLFVPFDYYQQSKVFDSFSRLNSLESLFRLNFSLLKKLIIVLLSSLLLLALVAPKYLSVALMVFFLSLLTYMPQAMRGALNTLGRVKCVNASQMADGILKPLIAWLFASYGVSSAGGMIFSNMLALLLSTGLLAYFCKSEALLRQEGQTFEKFQEIEILKHMIPISTSALMNWAQLQGYRVVLVPLGFSEVVGIYSVLSNLGHSAMGAASAIYSQIRSPELYRSAGGAMESYFIGAGLFSVLIALSSWVISPFLVPYVTKATFAPYADLVTFGVLIEGGSLMLGGLMIYFTILSKTRVIAFSGIWAAAVSALGFISIYFFSAITAYSIGVVLLLSQSISVFFLFVQSRKEWTK